MFSKARQESEVKAPFFIVWGPQGVYNPKYRHNTHDEAAKAAREMALKHVGKEFFVMEATESFQVVDPVKRTLFGEKDEIPF